MDGGWLLIVVYGLPGGFRCCLVLAAAVAAWRLAVVGVCGLSYTTRIMPWGPAGLVLAGVSSSGMAACVVWLFRVVGY